MAKMVKKTISYGVLSDPEQDAGGFVFFGAGNTASGWHSKQAYAEPLPLEIALAKIFGCPVPQTQLEATAGLKVHYRTGEDAAPANANGDKYNVDGGYQQDGVHNASGTNMNRASWNVDFSLYDRDGDFSGAYLWVDIDPTAKKDFLKFKYDDDNNVFVAKDKDGNTHVLETGTGNGGKPGEVLQDSINIMFFKDLIDNDGNAKNGFQAWDMEHGQFDFVVGQFDNGVLETSVTVNVGAMLIPDMI